MRRRGPPRLTGWHVLWIVLGFFAFVGAVNGVMVWFAMDTFPGIQRDAPKGDGR